MASSSVGSRMKKNLGTKVAASKLGRKIIQQYMGEEGNNIISAVKSAMARNKDIDEARKNKQMIFKFAVKAKLMADSGFITSKHVQMASTPLNTLANLLIIALQDDADVSDMTFQSLLDAFARVQDTLTQILSPHMTEHNTQKLDGLLSYIGSRQFLRTIIDEPEYANDREKMCDNLQLMMKVDMNPNFSRSLKRIASGKRCLTGTGLTDSDKNVLEIVLNFWTTCVIPKEQKIAEKLFVFLSNADERMVQVFPGTDEEIKAKIMDMFRFVIQNLEDFPSLLTKMDDVAKVHEEKKIYEQSYVSLWNALNSALVEVVTDAYTEQVKRCWLSVYTAMANILRVNAMRELEQLSSRSEDEFDSDWEKG